MNNFIDLHFIIDLKITRGLKSVGQNRQRENVSFKYHYYILLGVLSTAASERPVDAGGLSAAASVRPADDGGLSTAASVRPVDDGGLSTAASIRPVDDGGLSTASCFNTVSVATPHFLMMGKLPHN